MSAWIGKDKNIEKKYDHVKRRQMSEKKRTKPFFKQPSKAKKTPKKIKLSKKKPLNAKKYGSFFLNFLNGDKNVIIKSGKNFGKSDKNRCLLGLEKKKRCVKI